MAALLALAAAVGTAIAYGALAGRLHDGALPRRQLDAWAALLSLVCLGSIAYGGADGWRVARRATTASRPVLAVARPPVARMSTPDLTQLAWPAWPEPARPASPDIEAAVIGAPPATQSAMAAVAESIPGTYIRASSRRGAVANGPALAPVLESPLREAADDRGAPGGTPTATSWAWYFSTPTPRAVIWPTSTPASRPTGIPIGPTAAPPTEEPLPVATATPQCGDPADISLRVERVDASVDRAGSDTVVHYVIRVRNESGFPATMADIVVTALSHSASSEQFGHAALPDMSLMPGAVIDLEGALTLVKSPPPFGTTDLCVAFVGETCGRRPAYHVTRQCTRVSGL